MDRVREFDNPCPSCGGRRVTLEAKCKNCGWKPQVTRTPAITRAKVTFDNLLEAMRTTSLASLFLITLLVAVFTAILLINVRLGCVLLAVGFVALCRTGLYSLYHKARGQTLSIAERAGAYLLSFLFVGIVAATCITAFVTICVPVTIASKNLWIGTSLSSFAATFLFFFLLWLVPVGPSEK